MPQSASPEAEQSQGKSSFSSADNEQLLAEAKAEGDGGAVVTPINEKAQRYLDGADSTVSKSVRGYNPDAEQLLAVEEQRLREQNGSAAFEQLIQEAEVDEDPMSEEELAETRLATVHRNRSSRKAA